MLKKFLSTLILSILLITVYLPSAFAADIVYQYVSTVPLSKGVFLDTYRLYMSDGTWNNAKVVRGDLTNPDLSINALYDSRGVSYLNTVPNIARENNTIAAINADYFGWGEESSRGYSIGAAYKDSEFLTSTSLQDGMNVMGIDLKGNFIFDIFQLEVELIAPNGNSQKIRAINKYDELKEPVLYNHNWGSSSLGSYGNLHEMVIKNGVVQEIRFDSPPVALDQDTMVVAALADWTGFLTDNFKPGDPAVFKIKANPSPESLKMAVGGGAIMVQDGKIPSKYSHIQYGINPLSATGVSKDGKTFYLITVDGRLAESRGMSQKELSAFMLRVGVYNGIGFDGGGSTTMSVQMPDAPSTQQVVNTPSDGSLRPISNILAISNTKQGDGVPAYLDIIDDGANVWKNTSTLLSAKVTDSFYTPLAVNSEDISWRISGVDGTIENGILKTTQAGSVLVTANAKGVTGTKKLKVLENPYSIVHSVSDISLNVGETKNIWLWARDEKGYMAPFKLSEAKCSVDKDIVSVNGTTLVGKTKGSALLSVSFGDATCYIAVHVGGDTVQITLPTDTTGRDSANITGLPPESTDRSLRLAVFGQMRSPNTLFDNMIMKRTINTINNSGADLTGFVSNYIDQPFLSELKMQTMTCEQYSAFTKGDNTIITLNTKNGGLYASGNDQWGKLMAQLSEVKTKNLFVFIPSHINFKSAEEAKVFKDALSDAASMGHEVYVFYNNWATACTPDNGVRYISTPGFSDDITAQNVAGRLFKLRYILLDVDKSGKVTYRFMQLY